MTTWQVIALVLAALLVGPAALALLELRATLRETRGVMRSVGARLDRTFDEASTALGNLSRTLDEASTAIGHLNRAGAAIEQSAERVRGVASGLSEVEGAVREAGASIRSFATEASAAFPTVLSGVQQWLDSAAEGGGREPRKPR